MTGSLTEQVRRELGALYRRVEDELDRHRPRCELSGRCCDFPTSGLALFATDLESAHALATAEGGLPDVDPQRCPWHVDGLCQNRDGRPLGCRLYFCDPAWEPLMPDLYERFHAELKALHARHGLAYRYQPFTRSVSGLAAGEQS
jgi:hypothetical protein